jgi:uncharacterized protein YrrD
VNIAKDLRLKVAKDANTAERLGEVLDVIVHPTRGTLLGLTLKTGSGRQRDVSARAFWIDRDGVVAIELGDATSSASVDRSGVRVEAELLGTKVVNAEGLLLGHIREVHLLLDQFAIVYRVTQPGLRGLLGGRFFMSGQVPCSYFRDGGRLIVPADTGRLRTFSSLSEAI